ncbi:MAG TPA: lysophospholipid acyltransferase family protein [Gemmatimonadales bacterium]|nr:lysophospholipid acyltransferase family protein [Gemmatimonadales bacterium]
MIRALRFLFAVKVLTLWYGGRVFTNAWRGVRHQPGGVYDEICREWGVKMMRWNRLRATVEGLDRLVPGQPYVYVANHASFVDIWTLLVHLPGSIRFVYKKELGSIPVFGPAIRASGHIAIDRQNRASAFSAYDVAAGDVRGGTSAMVFAEGRRSADGRLMTFKKGPFVLAIAAGVPVVPVAVLGTFESLPKGSIAPRQVPISIRIGAPIHTEGLTYEDRDAVSRQCRLELEALGVPPGD